MATTSALTAFNEDILFGMELPLIVSVQVYHIMVLLADQGEKAVFRHLREWLAPTQRGEPCSTLGMNMDWT